MSIFIISTKQTITILFTCIGRRVALLESFRAACKALKVKLIVIGTDVTQNSAALQCCDIKEIVAPVDTGLYTKQILALVKKHKVNLLIPTVDLDLALWATKVNRLKKLGCTALISSPDVIDICEDKRKTFKALKKLRFGTPETFTPAKILKSPRKQYPYILKPWDGHASRAIHLANNKRELEFFSKYVPHCIVQEYVVGDEYTIDVLVDFDMNVRCVVPRKRIQVRGGEVSKGITVKHREIMAQSKQLVEQLGCGPGVITLQCMLTEDNKIKFIEINPRFGGGILLSIKAGANFPKWVVQLVLGQTPRIALDNWQDKLTMLRYDNAIWVNPIKKEAK